MLEAGLENSGTGAEETQKSFVGYKSNIGNKYFNLETDHSNKASSSSTIL